MNAHNEQQPAAAQEAVGYVHGEPQFGNAGRKIGVLTSDVPMGTKLYAAPVTAAPGIDIEQFREPVTFWFEHIVTHPFTETNAARLRKAKHLLALIDASPKGDGSSSVAPPALYQHDDGRYALALGDVARHRLTDGDPGWHRVPLDVVEADGPKGATLNEQFGSAEGLGSASGREAHYRQALERIATQGPHYGPDGTRETWKHWSDIARDALVDSPQEASDA